MADASTHTEKQEDLNIPQFREDILKDDPNKGALAEGTSVEELSIDPLTGLLNRGLWEAEMRQEYEHSLRNNKPFAIAMMDVDNLKLTNDMGGHSAGDELLRKMGEAIRKRARLNDILGRFGGDEAISMMCDFELEEEEIGNLEMRYSEDLSQGGVNVSVGIAKWDGKETLDEIIERADDRLLTVKAERKSRQNA